MRPRLSPIRMAVLMVALYLAGPAAAMASTIDFRFESPDRALLGGEANDRVGHALASADVNDDGVDDLIIGAPGVDFAGRVDCGAVYVVFSSDTLPATVALTSGRSDVTVIYGSDAGAQLGSVVSSGDINNDGYADVVCGMSAQSPNGQLFSGEVAVIFGAASLPGVIDVAAPGVVSVTRIEGEGVFDRLGSAVAVGPVDGGPHGDLVIGAPFADAPGRSFAGRAYIVYGADSWPAVIDLSNPAVAITRLFGERSNDVFGTACAVGDVNDDAIADIIIGAPQAPPLGRTSAGEVYVFPGAASHPDTIDTSTPVAGMTRIYGAVANNLTGSALDVADVNDSGVGDMIIGAPEFSPPGRSKAGAVYVAAGAVSLPSVIDLATDVVVRIDGPEPGLHAGLNIGSGDFNFDMRADILIGLPDATPTVGRSNAGKVFAVFGRRVYQSPIDLAVFQNGVVTVFGGFTDENLGRSVTSGKTSSSGFDDLLMGSPGDSVGLSVAAGQVKMLFGSADITATQLANYRALLVQSDVRIEWHMSDDEPLDGFELTRSSAPSQDRTAIAVRRQAFGAYFAVDASTAADSRYSYELTFDGDILFKVSVQTPPRPARLYGAFPSPFATTTRVAFDVPRSGHASLRIYDVRGRHVATLLDQQVPVGPQRIAWDGTRDDGSSAASGVYFARLEFEGRAFQVKIQVVR